MTVDYLHLAQPRSANPACGLDDDRARLTSNWQIVTCPGCKVSALYRNRENNQPERRPLGRARHSGVSKVRADASTYLRRALQIIERLPVLA